MKIIGITTRILTNEIDQKIEKVPHSLINKITNCGAIPIIIPFTDKEKLIEIVNLCDGFVIPGGNTWHVLDEIIINYAIKNDKPLLGICAGMQALGNIHNFCGTNDSDQSVLINSKINHYDSKHEYVHDVNITGSLMKKILHKDRIQVNSRHHYKIEKYPYYNVEALSSDGIIEAISLPNKKFILGVQWHPEDLNDENSERLFEYFINSL